MSNSDRLNVAIVPEVVWGVPPAATQLQDLPFTSESLEASTDYAESGTVRADRQTPDLVAVGRESGGELNVDFTTGNYDILYEAALMSTQWSAPVTVASADTDVSAASGSNTLTHSTGWAAVPEAGQWVRIQGFTREGNNGYARVVSATATDIVLWGLTLTTESAGAAVTIVQGGSITNGVTERSFSIEKHFQDLNSFELHFGQSVKSMKLEAKSKDFVKGGFGFMGKDAESRPSTIGTGSNQPALDRPTVDVLKHVQSIIEGGSPITISQFSVALDNNVRSREVIGELGPESQGFGRLNLSGSLQTYLSSAAQIDKYLNRETSALATVIEDGLGNGFVLDIPSIKYTSGRRTGGGINQDIMADLQWKAKRDPVLGHTIRIARFDAA